jgi:hypothetical protein
MCYCNCANQNGGICRFYLSGPELRSASLVVYYPSRLTANASIKTMVRFVRACSSSRPPPPPPPPPPRLWRLQRLPLPLGRRKILRPLQMCFVQFSHKFGRIVFVHLEAACTCKRTREFIKRVEKQQCSKSNNAAI